MQQELDALRSTVAELVPVEGRPVGAEDTVIVDLISPQGETRRDYVVELGRGAVVDEIEQSLVGMSAGETKEIDFELADDSKQTVSVTVKEIKEKVLPELDDELARSASEFDTLDELRAEIEERLRAQIAEESDAQFRSDVADALVAASKVDASGPLVEARTRELLRGLARQVEARGIPLDTYLTMTGQAAGGAACAARRTPTARSRASWSSPSRRPIRRSSTPTAGSSSSPGSRRRACGTPA